MAITQITTASIVDDAITSAKIGANQIGNSELDLTDAYAFTGTVTGVGKILQVVQYKTNGSFSTSSGTAVTTGFAQAITPSSASNKVLVIVSSGIGVPTSGVIGHTEIYRGASGITNVYNSFGTADYECQGFSIIELDSPNTTSATTYTLYAHRSGQSATMYVGARRDGGTPITTTITLMEIAG